jgi:methanethiol S-methyltransferase
MWKFLFAVISYIIGVSSMMFYFLMIQFGMDQAAHVWSLNAMILDVLLFGLFPLQHSLLARPKAKEMTAKILGSHLLRAFYVLTSGVVMWIVLLNWKNFGPYLYRFDTAIAFDVIFYLSLALIILSTVALDHSMMFGLKQGYSAWKNLPLPESGLQTDGLYGLVRHPITSLLLIALWSHHTLTAGRCVFNILFSSYAIAGTWFEERDLVKAFGKEYEDYRKKVPAFIPRLSRS